MIDRIDRDGPTTPSATACLHQGGSPPMRPAATPWQRPRITVIPLDCEISAYAPDGEDPLF